MPSSRALRDDDQQRVRVLAGILRVAVGLDRNHGGRVRSVTCHEGRAGVMTVEVTAMPGQDVSLELYAANGRADLLAEALGGPVEVVERPPTASPCAAPGVRTGADPAGTGPEPGIADSA